ncbi:hypothetical protein NGM10_08130 [Halorussus salilacus]|uniref:DUF7504 family protein n=1 Tax=Halorussus salilacus TaxID=2953750 RepID=UPI0020A1CBC4|nr:hypothetical protein [Halorussus salilacus]USZ66712.1 hypothetical protein NGM10_08130 [Halorussus salilacus]
MNDDRAGAGSETFHERLRALKRRGCNLLVTGEVREAVSQRMTRKLMGSSELPRTRVLALTDQDVGDVPNLLPAGVSPSDDAVHVVDPEFGTRSASAESARPTGPGWSRSDLNDLQTRLCNAIATAKIANSGFDSAELRVSLFTLSFLVNRHDTAAVERFVTAVGDHVEGSSGMAHYHLPLPDDSKTVRRLAPLFDARIELREKNGRPEQRWHLPGCADPTSWVGL